MTGKSRGKTPPYFKNRVDAKRSTRKATTTLLAQSTATGLQHQFQNAGEWERIADQMEQSYVANLNQMVLSSLPFATHLSTTQISTELISVACPRTLYRLSNPKYGALSIEGNIAHGGRFNVGGAQISAQFPNLQPRPCVYLASTEQCALAEAVKPLGNLKMYEVRPKIDLNLWDLVLVIQDLNYPNLLDEVKRSNGEALWGLQKVPTISQILADHLRNLGGDGLIFESTKHAPDKNVALFVKDTAHANVILESITNDG